MMPSLLLDPGGLDDRPPDRDVGFLLRHQRFSGFSLSIPTAQPLRLRAGRQEKYGRE